MDVDVDHFRRHIQAQKAQRIATDHDQSAVGFGQCVLQGAVADVAPIQKQILHSLVGSADRWVDHVATQRNIALCAVDGNQVFFDLGSVKGSNSLPPRFGGRQLVHHGVVVDQSHLNFGVGQGHPGKRFYDVPFFRLRSPQELLSNGRIIKQLPNFNFGSHRATAGFDRFRVAAVDQQFVPALAVGRPRPDHALGNFGN